MRKSVIGGILLMAALIAVWFVAAVMVQNKVWMPHDQPIVISSGRFGSLDTAVVQVHRGLGIYDTSFFVRWTNRWTWFYLDHDGGYWRDVQIINNNVDETLVVKKKGRIIGCYELKNGIFSNGLVGFTYSNPSGWVDGDLVENWTARHYERPDGR